MPEVEITIGGRAFRVACQEGEEHFLRSAAGMLDTEAQALQSQLGRLAEPRMLLMAGLMLADRTAAVEDELRSLKALSGQDQTHAPERIEVPTVPAGLIETLADLATRAEAMAAEIEKRAAG